MPHRNNIWRGLQPMKLFFYATPPIPCRMTLLKNLRQKLGFKLQLLHRKDGFKIAVPLNAFTTGRCTDVCIMWGIKGPYGEPSPALKG
jgi:hypothetical protein